MGCCIKPPAAEVIAYEKKTDTKQVEQKKPTPQSSTSPNAKAKQEPQINLFKHERK